MTEPVYDFLRDANERWQRIVEQTSPATRRVAIADVPVDLVIAGGRLQETLLPAFECHAATSAPPDATVGAWDAEETDVPLPARLHADDPLVRQWMVRRDGRPMAEIEWPSDEMVRIGNRYVGRHLLGVARTSVLSPWEAGAPLRRQLWWALGSDVLFAHAGAVGDTDGVALIMGASGAGKSTTALSCALSGMGLLADDYCLVKDDPPVAHVLHATARVHPRELPNLDGIGDAMVSLGPPSDDPDMKVLLFPYRAMPGAFLPRAPVRVALILHRGPEPGLEPMRAADALRAVAPSAMRQMHLDAGSELNALRRIVTSVPCHRLVLHRDRVANADLIRGALAAA